MEVVSTSNLISSENKKKKTTKKKQKKTACNFQTLAKNSFVIVQYLMRGQMGTYAYMQTSSYL